jgi:5'-methylthioadenosine phosphorylase
VLAPCAVGGLRADLGPGTLVVPDQLVDRTSGRVHTYYDEGAVHVSMAEPYCPRGRATVLDVAGANRWSPVDGGTLVVIEGPRFSTRAESRWFSANGWSVVGMTGYPEAVMAREMALCYTTLCLVTDLDAGQGPGEGVTHAEVLEVFARNIDRLKTLLTGVLPRMPAERTCTCASALDGLKLPFELP